MAQSNTDGILVGKSNAGHGAVVTKTTYEGTVIARTVERAGRNPHLKGHIHEILVKEVTSQAGIDKLVKQCADGEYRSAQLVGSEESAQVFNKAGEKAGTLPQKSSIEPVLTTTQEKPS